MMLIVKCHKIPELYQSLLTAYLKNRVALVDVLADTVRKHQRLIYAMEFVVPHKGCKQVVAALSQTEPTLSQAASSTCMYAHAPASFTKSAPTFNFMLHGPNHTHDRAMQEAASHSGKQKGGRTPGELPSSAWHPKSSHRCCCTRSAGTPVCHKHTVFPSKSGPSQHAHVQRRILGNPLHHLSCPLHT
eukprot:916984-Pelagomonas_calceolata.AAC.3